MPRLKPKVGQARRNTFPTVVPITHGHNAYGTCVATISYTETDDHMLSQSFTSHHDYFNYQPKIDIHDEPHLKRSHIPTPLQLQPDDNTPLSAGPSGYKYTPLSLRTPDLESFRYDHGIEFKRHLSIKDTVLKAQWHQIFDEDALLARTKRRSLQSLRILKTIVRSKFARGKEFWNAFCTRFKREFKVSQVEHCEV
ncbi:hypothetical protein COCC4DRAFT_55419 [Bipolaris maydis ATCC 48331]|uniref:Uncharacterized protein n=2 Tax=Cochliobolus heterostrophus TaxID=5016 RepID=M2V842_COCH5|nr:uncharacterized protein COCC4DRAFT_55419 [Bipolaris maydis ATCC 48331]EMD95898.1 hypothetical protein COCHEDRAFT_1026708 [Bipolaris maydis C5]KAJ5030607.1 hypothetical protein J3E73DRAFT_365948 [Bipolaris maydis]ENI10757.1 hypothetical protein COCC4DRAFT_55419 [Bipolaris maydis ATCC 48331]KAJ6274553.1 hypothetical protein PSV08DRAFT_347294 [Bipolaris maydis]KAJ6286164.1 hypothetical protein J3E71DRAFT_338313 [Bipolaris maydis]